MPDRTTEAILIVGGTTKLSLGGDLRVAPTAVVQERMHASVNFEAAQKLYLEMERKYTLEKVLVSAIGEKQPMSRWLINSGSLIRDDVSFIAVLRVPKTVQAFTIQATATFIDKLFGIVEKSKTVKKAEYSCRTQPAACTYSAK